MFNDVAIDGNIGPVTKARFTESPFEVQALIHRLFLGFTDPFPLSIPGDMSMTQNERHAQYREIAEAILKAADDLKVPAKWLVAFARIESNFNPLATNGSSRGLFQLQEAAWDDASKLVKLPNYIDSWMDPVENAKAAAAYVRINYSQLKRKGLDASLHPEYIYLAHQQGIAGFLEIKRVAEGGRDLGRIPSDRLWRNPAPGSSRTTNPVVFYHNWMSYLRKFF
jgi:hypothetical protein